MDSCKVLLRCCHRRPYFVVKRWNHQYMRFSRMFPSVTIQEEDLSKQLAHIGMKHASQQKLYIGAAQGTFYFLPTLTRALEKLYRLIDHEMRSFGAQKITMPCLAPATIWRKSGRWEEMGSELITFQNRHKVDYCLAPTHEEAVTSLVAADKPISYKRLPIKLYQIGRKFRDERRPKHGLLRCREFEMKDLYTFSADEECARLCYEEVCEAYSRLLQKLEVPFLKVDASVGAMGGSRSQEFHLLSAAGEDTLYECSECGAYLNRELIDGERFTCQTPDCKRDFTEHNGIEVAHAFILGTKYSAAFDATFVDNSKTSRPLFMGCFGIGVTRMLSALTEVLSTPDALRWPRLLAPHQACIIPQKKGYKSDVTDSLADGLLAKLSSLPNMNYEVVLDDRTQLSIGNRMKQARAMGFPFIIALGKKALAEEPEYELVDTHNNIKMYCTLEQLLVKFSQVDTVVV